MKEDAETVCGNCGTYYHRACHPHPTCKLCTSKQEYQGEPITRRQHQTNIPWKPTQPSTNQPTENLPQPRYPSSSSQGKTSKQTRKRKSPMTYRAEQEGQTVRIYSIPYQYGRVTWRPPTHIPSKLKRLKYTIPLQNPHHVHTQRYPTTQEIQDIINQGGGGGGGRRRSRKRRRLRRGDTLTAATRQTHPPPPNPDCHDKTIDKKRLPATSHSDVPDTKRQIIDPQPGAVIERSK